MDRQQEFALRTVEERDVRFIRLWFTDVLGTLKSVAIAPAELEAAFEEGLGFDGSAIEGMTRVSEDDMIVQPDPSTFQILPWRGGPQGTARMFCDILTPDGEPSLGDPRHVLKRALAKAKDKGFTFYVHPEIEFYLFESQDDWSKAPTPIDERQPFRGGLLPYTQLPEREAAGSGDIEPGHPNTFTKTAEDLPETRKRTEIHMDGGKRGEGSCTPSYCCQWDRSYITHHKRSMGKGMDMY